MNYYNALRRTVVYREQLDDIPSYSHTSVLAVKPNSVWFHYMFKIRKMLIKMQLMLAQQ